MSTPVEFGTADSEPTPKHEDWITITDNDDDECMYYPIAGYISDTLDELERDIAELKLQSLEQRSQTVIDQLLYDTELSLITKVVSKSRRKELRISTLEQLEEDAMSDPPKLTLHEQTAFRKLYQDAPSLIDLRPDWDGLLRVFKDKKNRPQFPVASWCQPRRSGDLCRNGFAREVE